MKEELEAKIKQNRSSSDRSSTLEAKLKANRRERPSRTEKEARLKEMNSAGTEHLHQMFASEYKGRNAQRLGVIADKVAEEQIVRPSIVFSSGIPSLDIHLGGGFPTGAVELFGEESVGKSSLASEMMMAAQGSGNEVALCPTEFVDVKRMEAVGVDLKKLILIRGDYGEDVLLTAQAWLTEKNKRVLFIDTGTGLRPQNDFPGHWILMMRKWLSETLGLIHLNNCIVMINQARARLSIKPGKLFAGGSDDSARKASHLFATRLELSRENVTENEYDLVVNILKNSLKAPSRMLSLPVVKNEGVDVWKDVVRTAVAYNVVQKEGSWYRFTDINLGQGEEAAARFIEEDAIGDIVFKFLLRRVAGF